MHKPPPVPLPLDFRLPDWMTLDAAFGRVADLYGGRSDLSAAQLYQALLDGRLGSGEVQVQRNGPPLQRLLESEFWRQFGGIYADREGKPRFLPVPRGVGGVVPMPIVRSYFFVRCSDLDAHYPPVKADKVDEMEPPRRQPGRRRAKYKWPEIEEEIVRNCRGKSGRVTDSERELARKIAAWCIEKFEEEPPESMMREKVKKICALQRRLPIPAGR